MKNKLFSLIIGITFLLPLNALAEEALFPTPDTDNQTKEALIEQTDDESLNSEEDVSVKSPVLPYKQPTSKKKLAKKFLMAMFAVCVSSFILYFGLSLYNKLRSGLPSSVKTPDGETPLESPSDIETAVRIFLDKTKWQ